MTKSIKLRVLIYALLVALLFTNFSAIIVMPTSAAELDPAANSGSIVIEEGRAQAGKSVSLNILIEDNPGLAALSITLNYDKTALTLTNIKNGEIFPTLDTGRNLFWSADENCVENGVLATLTFEVNANAEKKDYTISAVLNESLDENYGDVEIAVVSGKITVYDILYGDVNGDGEVGAADVLMLRKYMANYDYETGTSTISVQAGADANGDGDVGAADVLMLRKYMANYDYDNGSSTIVLGPKVEEHKHTEVIDPAVAPTYESTGLTEGAHCSSCGAILKKQEVVEKLKGQEVYVEYDIYGSDAYLESVVAKKLAAGEAIHDNPEKINTTESGYTFLNIPSNAIPGYTFLGWYDGYGDNAVQIKTIEKGQEGNIQLYAHWKKVVYTVTFDSPDVDVTYTWYDEEKGEDTPLRNKARFTVDTGVKFTNPEIRGYTFVGWSIDGKIVSGIPVGFAGDVTVHANWTSDRNKGESIKALASPNIIEDMDNGRYYFVYEIGTIQKVPLAVLKYHGNPDTLTITKGQSYTTTIDETLVNKLAKTVSNATTTTSSWTLSEEWNQTASATNETDEQIGKTEGRVDSEGNVTGEKYYVSNVSGGSTAVSTNSGGSSSSSSKVTTGVSTGLTDSYHDESEINKSVDVNVKAGMGVGYGPFKAEVSAEMGANVSTHDKSTHDLVETRNTNVGTYRENNSSSYWDTNKSSSSSWNTTNSYETSAEASQSTELSKVISEIISNRYGYTSTDSHTENNSSTITKGGEETLTDEYEVTVEYSLETKTVSYEEETRTYTSPGYCRTILAGTAHVFAVVGYDISTSSYFTTTYTVLDNDTYVDLDFSAKDPTFNDCENAIIPFEVPYYVHEYISGIIARSEGLVVDPTTGYITEYEDPYKNIAVGIGHEQNIVIPEYISVDNGDGTYSAVRVRGIASTAFKGSKITGIYLPKYISEIPDGAFEGCANLNTVIGYGITDIGNNAFKGCKNLTTFVIDEYIKSLGENAFEDCMEVLATPANASVAEAVLNSGAKKITLDLTKLSESFDNKEVVIADSTEYFALFGGGKTFTNLQIESDAAETFISNITFAGNVDTPIKLSSDTITLGRVTVENAPGFALIIDSECAEVKLLGDINLSYKSANAVISKDVIFSKANSGVAGYMKVTGKYLICGTVTNEGMLQASGGIHSIDEDTFNSMLSSSIVAFDANGGSVAEESKTVYYDQYYGSLPTPTRENYTFTGWYTEAEGGVQITADSIVTALVNQTLYAHWSPNPFTIYFDANGGNVSPSSKTLTFGNALGSLPTPTRENYTFAGWYDVNGNRVYDSTVPGSATNFTVYAHWTPNTFTLYYDAKGGYVSTSSKTLTFGNSLGSLPTPTRDYYKFLGWYDANGNRVYDSTVPGSATNLTIYAYWEINPAYWVKAADMPENAQVVSRKWTYSFTETTESTSATLDGWVQTGNYWKEIGSGSVNYASFPSGFDTSNTYYKSFAKEAFTAYDDGSTKRVVTNTKDGWIYWHWMYNVHYANVTERAISSKKGTYNNLAYVYFYAIKSNVNCPELDKYYCNSQNIMGYNCHSILPKSTSPTDGMGCPRFFRFQCYLSSYVDYQKIYQYTKVTDNIESSTAISNGGQYSNVTEWVYCRSK